MEAESAAPGSGVERSGDEIQRKDAGSADSAVGAGIVAAEARRNCATRHGGREMRPLFIF